MSYDINLKHLEYFIKVARLGSINKAAQMLYELMTEQAHIGRLKHGIRSVYSRDHALHFEQSQRIDHRSLHYARCTG